MKSLSLFVLAALAIPGFAADYTLHSFKKLHLEKYYWSEGATFGDLNHDGKPDAVSGPWWWEGPAFTKRHEIYPPKTTFKVKQDDGTRKHCRGLKVFSAKRTPTRPTTSSPSFTTSMPTAGMTC